jgi:hypothetical protein
VAPQVLLLAAPEPPAALIAAALINVEEKRSGGGGIIAEEGHEESSAFFLGVRPTFAILLDGREVGGGARNRYRLAMSTCRKPAMAQEVRIIIFFVQVQMNS